MTGGVVSSLGKGIAAASLGRLLVERGLRVTMLKFDPYLNVDPGTMSPFQHGEVFVTDDGAETDLDLGHYERFIDRALSQANNVTTGPHLPERHHEGAARRVPRLDGAGHSAHHRRDQGAPFGALSPENDVVIVEVGGTVGDIESLPFLEAIRQFRHDVGRENAIFVHLTLMPYIAAAGELKTKPTQHSVRELMQIGIQPDILILRTERPISDEIKRKIALFCNVEFGARHREPRRSHDLRDPAALPRAGLRRKGAAEARPRAAGAGARRTGASSCSACSCRTSACASPSSASTPTTPTATRACRKRSSTAASRTTSASTFSGCRATTSPSAGRAPPRSCAASTGCSCPGGFGVRGVEGMVEAIRHARENGLPFFGICLGMQTAIIEFARNVCGLDDSHSSEFAPECDNPVISLMESQQHVTDMGGTMRLGAYPCRLARGSRAAEIYGAAGGERAPSPPLRGLEQVSRSVRRSTA